MTQERRLARKIGRLLRLERQRVDLSQEQFASRAGVSRQVVARFESGKHSMTCDSIERMFEVLGQQLLPTLEAADRDLEDEIAEAKTEGRLHRDRMIGWLNQYRRLVPGAPEMLLDGAVAANLLGVPIFPRRLDLLVAEADLDRLASWMLQLTAIRRYDERTRDYSSWDIDPRRPGPLRWSISDYLLGVELLPVLPEAVIVQHESGSLRVRPLCGVVASHSGIAHYMDRLGKRSPSIKNH